MPGTKTGLFTPHPNVPLSVAGEVCIKLLIHFVVALFYLIEYR